MRAGRGLSPGVRGGTCLGDEAVPSCEVTFLGSTSLEELIFSGESVAITEDIRKFGNWKRLWHNSSLLTKEIQ